MSAEQIQTAAAIEALAAEYTRDDVTAADLAAVLAPVERCVSYEHQLHHETHACETCNGLGVINRHEHWIPCLPCNGLGYIDSEWREATA